MFPPGFPDFTDDQKRRLKDLHVCDEQITALRYALVSVRSFVRQPAANNEMAAYLEEVERLANVLSRKLRTATAIAPDAALMLEKLFWAQRPTDEGPNMAANLCPRLDALIAASAEARESLPVGKQARSRVGNPEPVRRIDEALFHGWHMANRPAEAYPIAFRPSVSASSAFVEIVGICYTAAGYEQRPKRALQAYATAFNKDRRKLLRDMDEALSGMG